ncbi:MAG: TorF family putative porin [Burkholderiaceae bacterium]
MTPHTLARLALACAALLAAPAFADGLSANVALATKYKYRGQDQSDPTKDAVPAIQGGFDYALGGFYVGNWNSSVSFANALSGRTIGTEMDLYGGYKGKVSVLDYDVGLLQYYYPGSGGSLFNTTELYGQLGWLFITAKYSLTVSDRYFGWSDARNTGYLDVSANYEIAKGLTLNGHVGQTLFASGAKSAGAANYTDYKLGATYDFGGGLTLAGAFVGADKKNVYGDINKGRVIVTLGKSL